MLWYFLYPLRGTTQPPRLSANHPVRRAFYRHGKTTAQHWLLAMLVTVAIAMGFSYPTIFLSENPASGFAAYPRHVWTTAKPLEENSSTIDVEMRQVWIHGSFMKVLDKDVLKKGLRIQQALVDGEKLTATLPTLNEKVRSGALSWGFHSPLMYWNNSAMLIDEDDDILRTVNDQSRTSSSLNVALRPASVFAGKKFDHKKLLAADALVLTLMNKVEDNAGGKWQDRMETLADGVCENCMLFPRDGRVTPNRVYEFSFTPLSVHENIAFTFAYSFMALYVLLSLRRLKAFHSRFGLVVTAITQMTCSILASFTICGILKIDLSMIPQNAYPFVVLVIGLENMFRLINAVLAYPATMATDQRIANALGDIGPVSVAAASQNLIILSALSRFVSPGVAAFCAFACIATLFDAFFLLTFFVAVLNVDIRRLELQDALVRSNQQHRHHHPHNHHNHHHHHHHHHQKRKHSPSRHTWFDALMQGRLPFSTRMAGTAVTTTFILSLNYHFFERHEKATSLRHLLGLARGAAPSLSEFDTFTPPPMNATLTPGEWMRMQDFDTAREVMWLAKPGADSFVIRVFAPLVVVLSGADRTGVPLGTEAWFHALRGFAIHHFYPVAVAVVFAVAFVAVLMNFLLYSEAGDESYESSLDDEDRFQDEETFKLQDVALPHKLDIIKLSGTAKGHLVTVGLDRTIAIAKFDRAQQAYSTFGVPHDVLCQMRWPIREVVLDENAEWLACHCADDRVIVYNCSTGVSGESIRYPDDNPPVLMQFVRLESDGTAKTYLLLLTSGGRLAMGAVDGGEPNIYSLSETPLLGAMNLSISGISRKLLLVREDAKVAAYNWNGVAWIEAGSQLLPVKTFHGRISGRVQLETHADLGPEIVLATTSSAVIFLDSQSLATISSLNLESNHEVVRQVILGSLVHCPACGFLALNSIALACEWVAAQGSRIVTFTTSGDDWNNAICLRKTTPSCQALGETSKATHELANAGAWRGVGWFGVLGLRRELEQTNVAAFKTTQMRQRHRASRGFVTPAQDEKWAAYSFTPDGEVESIETSTSYDIEGEAGLYVHRAGPTAALGEQAVAVAFGNRLKVIRVTIRGSSGGRINGMGPTLDRQAASSKRRLTLRKNG